MTKQTYSGAESPLTASVERLRKEVDHLLELAWQQGEKALDKFGFRAGALTSSPAVDVLETEDDVLVLVDLPGVDPNKISVELSGNMLTVTGERPVPEAESCRVAHTRERFSGTFRRSVPLPVPVNADDVEAEAVNGVLRVRMPKTESARSKRIPIRTERSAASTSSPGPVTP